ncbi:MAG: hypothetical protein QOJ96_2115 [Alphaproteobacteria bacterium]|nr:hypothetical protein [Alphaproteobacteria bacterium]
MGPQVFIILMNTRRLIRIGIVTGVWLVASPSVQWQFNAPSWVEVGPLPAQARAVKQRPHRIVQQRTRRTLRGSSTPVLSNQPGLYPMQTYAPPATPGTAPTVLQAPPVPGYSQVPTVAILPRGSTGGASAETFSDKVVRCNHQAGLGGLTGGDQSTYVSTCAGQ